MLRFTAEGGGDPRGRPGRTEALRLSDQTWEREGGGVHNRVSVKLNSIMLVFYQ